MDKLITKQTVDQMYGGIKLVDLVLANNYSILDKQSKENLFDLKQNLMDWLLMIKRRLEIINSLNREI